MNRTYYIKTSTPAYLADWFKLKDALAAFIRANYTDYSFDDAIKKEGEYCPRRVHLWADLPDVLYLRLVQRPPDAFHH